jgi:hypothetical protein
MFQGYYSSRHGAKKYQYIKARNCPPRKLDAMLLMQQTQLKIALIACMQVIPASYIYIQSKNIQDLIEVIF